MGTGAGFDIAQALQQAVRHHEAGRLREAEQLYRQVLGVQPNHPDVLCLLGTLAHQVGDGPAAVKLIEKAIGINPRNAGYHFNLGVVLYTLERTEEAIQAYDKALQLDPENAEMHCNLGMAFKSIADYSAAARELDHALRLRPDFAKAHWNRGLLWFLQGDPARAWDDYAWRFAAGEAKVTDVPYPAWDGSAVAGRRMLICAEQGVGDEIMFASCFPDIIAEAGHCVIESSDRLQPLFARSFPEATVVKQYVQGDDFPMWLSGLGDIDVYAAAGTLPRRFRRTLSDFPERKSYLVPDPGKKARWQERISGLGPGLKVGISWRGGKMADVRRRRSTELGQWRDVLAVDGVHFVNLQYGECEPELAAVLEDQGIGVHDWADADPLRDLDDFAAQVAALDLVISVDITTVHMAGALGVPVWTLLPHVPDWRWMLEREDTPWYSSMRLFRQSAPGEWGPVFRRVAGALATYGQS